MIPLQILPTNETPLVDFKPDGNLWIIGRFIPLDGHLFFSDLIEWIEELCQDPPKLIQLNIEIIYHNDAASKALMQLIKTLQNADVNFNIDWYCKDDDDEVSFLGEMMSEH